MAIHKVIEVSAESGSSFEDAVQKAVTEASKSVRNIRSVFVKEQLAAVENEKITSYRVICKLSFEVE